MFNQIAKIIWNQRANNTWIWAEILLVSVCLWYIVDDLYTRATLYTSPMGYDISNVYLVELRLLTAENEQYRPQSEYSSTLSDDLLTVVARMRTYPGVEAVGISESSLPYSYSRNYTGFHRIQPNTGDTLNTSMVRRFFAMPDYIRVFRFATPQGDTEVLADNLTFNQIIISREIEEQLYPEGDAIGKEVGFHIRDSLVTRIGGVMRPIRFGDFDTYTPTFIEPMTEQALVENLTEFRFRYMNITLRTSPSAGKEFMVNFRKEMKNQLRYNNIYLLNISSYDDIRANYIHSDLNDTKMYLAGVFFLLINIFLGVVGTFWFRTQHRQGEMGLRIALGSTPANLRSLLIGEGLALLLFAAVPAAIIALNIGLKEIINVEIMPFTVGRFFLCQGITIALMGVMITIGIWFPSRKAIHIQPSEALRYE